MNKGRMAKKNTLFRAAQMKARLLEAEKGLVTTEFTEEAERIREKFQIIFT